MKKTVFLLICILVFIQLVIAGPVASAATYGICVTACGLAGVFAFGAAVVATNGAAAAALTLPGSGVFVTCSSMCTQMSGLALIIPST